MTLSGRLRIVGCESRRSVTLHSGADARGVCSIIAANSGASWGKKRPRAPRVKGAIRVRGGSLCRLVPRPIVGSFVSSVPLPMSISGPQRARSRLASRRSTEAKCARRSSTVRARSASSFRVIARLQPTRSASVSHQPRRNPPPPERARGRPGPGSDLSAAIEDTMTTTTTMTRACSESKGALAHALALASRATPLRCGSSRGAR